MLDQCPGECEEHSRVHRRRRVRDRRRPAERQAAERGGRTTPIIALTSYPPSAQFISGLFERGIDAYVEKPVNEHLELFLEKLRFLYGRAGRGDHARCAALARRASAAPVEVPSAAGGVVRVAIDGKVTKGGTEIVINGNLRVMCSDSKFRVVLRGLVARERSAEGWSSREAMGIGRSRNATTYIRKTFEGLAPDGFEVIESDGHGNVRLNPEIVVERVGWDALSEHPDPGVVRIALEQKKRRGG